jgi:hypothetical protein
MDEQGILVKLAGQEPVKLHHRLLEFKETQPRRLLIGRDRPNRSAAVRRAATSGAAVIGASE